MGGCSTATISDPRHLGRDAHGDVIDPGCSTPALVATGAPFPRDPDTLAIRWTGYTNFELAYGGQVVLLDTYFDRGSMYPPFGFRAADIKRADLIVIGHGHVDHMSDAASIATRTGAPVTGAPITIDKLREQSVDPRQLRAVTGRGGEAFQVGAFHIEPILGRHGEPPAAVTKAFGEALRATTTQPTAEQRAESAAIRKRGISGDPRVVDEGTIAFLITLDNGFRIMFRDSGGAITEYEKAAMAKVGRVDVALVAVSASFTQELVVKQALEHAQTYQPAVYIPGHHDGPHNGLWRPTEPLFQAVKAEHPDIVTVSRGYREPICFDTSDNFQRRGLAR
jgi:L-ascorbate metabolism protein UlaG (beta-lactamase superfamily)